ncbi:MAG: DUF167 domain-containing protein [Candidatus Aenigmarchaeota archaeon]|nr:DUF167 domain-containing protein [Candidatus Aenigmarchaeota archaeon]
MIIKIKVKTNSDKFKIIKHRDYWLVYVKSKPEQNKANIEIIKQFSKIYGKCRILKGLKSNNKLIEI